MKAKSTNKDLEFIKENLPHGGMTMIAEQLDVSVQSVSSVLCGKTKSHRIIMAALDMAIFYASERNKKIEKLRKIVNGSNA